MMEFGVIFCVCMLSAVFRSRSTCDCVRCARTPARINRENCNEPVADIFIGSAFNYEITFWGEYLLILNENMFDDILCLQQL